MSPKILVKHKHKHRKQKAPVDAPVEDAPAQEPAAEPEQQQDEPEQQPEIQNVTETTKEEPQQDETQNDIETTEQQQLQELPKVVEISKEPEVHNEEIEEPEADVPKPEEIAKNKEKTKRKPFSNLEDEIILKNYNGSKTNWKEICELLDNKRTAKSCLERYKYFLDPNYDHSPWEHEDLMSLCLLVKKFGTDWLTIRQFFPRRNPANIKNAFTAFTKANHLDRTDLVEKGRSHRMEVRYSNPLSAEEIIKIKETLNAEKKEGIGDIREILSSQE